MMKAIPRYPNYSATEDGRIYSHKTDKFLSPCLSKSGKGIKGLFLEKTVNL